MTLIDMTWHFDRFWQKSWQLPISCLSYRKSSWNWCWQILVVDFFTWTEEVRRKMCPSRYIFSSLLCIEQSFEVEGKNIFDRTRDQNEKPGKQMSITKNASSIFLRRNSKKVALHHAWWQFLKEGRKLPLNYLPLELTAKWCCRPKDTCI